MQRAQTSAKGAAVLVPPLLLSLALLRSSPALAEGVSEWHEFLDWPPRMTLDHVLVQAGLYTTHFSSDPDHTNDQGLISISLYTPDRWFAGGARFKNSFGQDSHYLYAGRAFPIWQERELSLQAKFSAGLLHGYRGEYRDKIPFNHLGVAPAALPTLAARWGRAETELIVFGTAGMMITAGWRF